MMGEGSSMAPVEVVVGQQYTAPDQVDLTIVPKMMIISKGNFAVTDANGNIKGKFLSLRPCRILLDATGNPIVSFAGKAHGKFTEEIAAILLFTVRKSFLFQFKTQLDVFLASNTSKDNPDFKIKRGWYEKSCTIYAEKSSTVIAQMHKKHSFSGNVLVKNKFAVTVYPRVDYAFIVALVVIPEEINEESKSNGSGGSDFGGASASAGGSCGGDAS